MKGFAWRRHSAGRWSGRQHSSLFLMALMHFRWPALDETQGSGSVEVLECSGEDERAQSGGTVHGAWGDSFMVEAVSREKGGGSTVQGGSKDRGVGGAGVKHGGVAPDGRHDEGMVETVVGRVNRRDRRKGGGLT
jgi:hypothetical protein